MSFIRFITALLLVITPAIPQQGLAADQDFDLILTQTEGENLLWYGYNRTTRELFELGYFGNPNYQNSYGHWVNTTRKNRVFVRKNRFGDYSLHSDLDDSTYHLGQFQDESAVFLDRDIDSSELMDAALVGGERRRWSWRISLNPLSGDGAKRRILFGGRNGVPFLFRRRGKSDSLGLLVGRGKRSFITYRSFNRKRTGKIRLKGKIPKNQMPVIMRSSRKRDSLVFVAENKLKIFNTRGRKEKSEIEVPEDSVIVVNDFNRNGLESAAFFLPEQLIFPDGTSERLPSETLKPLLDKVNTYQPEEISPTLAPTPSETATKTPLRTPTASPTATLQPTVTPPPTATPSLSPTPTNTTTATPSATPTRTATPTQTYTPTRTPSPTPTLTPTATLTPTQTSTPTQTPTPTQTVTPTAIGTPYVTSVVRKDCAAHLSAGETVDGNYLIDPDDNGALEPMRAYCDMTKDGGGWTLILNYVHRGGSGVYRQIRSDSLPIKSGNSLGSDEFNTKYWGHASTSLLSNLNISSLRFYCVTSDHSRTVSFLTSDSGCISYIRTGTGNCDSVSSNFVALADHNASIPGNTLNSASNRGDQALSDGTLIRSSNTARRWEIADNGNQDDFGCDNWDIGNNDDFHHEVWVR